MLHLMGPETLPRVGRPRPANPESPGTGLCRDPGPLRARLRLRVRAPVLSHVPAVPQVSCHAPAVGAEAREEYVRVVDAMGQKLRAAQYNGGYFDRGAKAGGRLCTPEGWFSCQVRCVPFAVGCPGAR